MSGNPHAVVIGAGPNGLSAAITVAMAGVPVTVYEANASIGGGARPAELMLPGFLHDICSAVHPMGCASPFFRELPLARHGLQWIHPEAPLAHPLDDGSAVILERSIEATARELGRDAGAYSRLMNPLARRWNELLPMILRPALRIPGHPFVLARFDILALLPARWLATLVFR
jgi:phytoene dehydrogenase-like protein